jgi:hypothetical protein
MLWRRIIYDLCLDSDTQNESSKLTVKLTLVMVSVPGKGRILRLGSHEDQFVGLHID